jgi:hypothetical protein
MRAVKYGLLAALVVGLVGVSVADAKKADTPKTIKEIMKKGHSAPEGEDPLCKKLLTGKASEAETKDLIALYEDLVKDKPPQGDADAFKKKATALLSAAKDVAAKKDGATDAYKKAVDCKACHTDFKPAK